MEALWQTDTVKLLVKVVTSGYAGDIITWTSTGSTDVVCDVQDINKEIVYKSYGIDGNEFKQVFDLSNAIWTKGNQVEYLSARYYVKLVNANMDKMSASNHTFVILEKVA